MWPPTRDFFTSLLCGIGGGGGIGAGATATVAFGGQSLGISATGPDSATVAGERPGTGANTGGAKLCGGCGGVDVSRRCGACTSAAPAAPKLLLCFREGGRYVIASGAVPGTVVVVGVAAGPGNGAGAAALASGDCAETVRGGILVSA